MGDGALARIAAIIKVEDDLQKIDDLRRQFTTEKALVDAKLQQTTQQQIGSIMTNMERLGESRARLDEIRANVDQIRGVYHEQLEQGVGKDALPTMAKVYEQMVQVQNLYTDIANFRQYVEHIENMIEAEFGAIADDLTYPLPNLYRVHYNVTQARNFLEYMEAQAQGLLDDTQLIVRKIVAPVGRMVRRFDDLLKEAIILMTEATKEGNRALVQRVVRVVELEARADETVALQRLLALPLAQDYLQFRARPRHYRKFFFDKMEESMAETFDKCLEHFRGDPLAVYDNLAWMEDELQFVAGELASLVPSAWQLPRFVLECYHTLLHKYTMLLVDGALAEDLMRILAYDGHYAKVVQAHFCEARSILGDELKETVLDDYSNVIISKMSEWNAVLMDLEAKVFTERDERPDNYAYQQVLEDVDAYDHVVLFEALTDVYVLPDFKATLSMLKEQVDVAADLGYGKVLVAVVENWARCYNQRVDAYRGLIDAEMSKYMSVYNNEQPLVKESRMKRFLKLQLARQKPIDISGMSDDELAQISKPGFIEYLTALGNTYEINNERLLDKFLPKYKAQVSAVYAERIDAAFQSTVGPTTDLNAMVVRALVDVMINDLLPALSAVFTSSWYDTQRVQALGEQDMAQKIVEALGEYMEDLKSFATYDIYSLTFTVVLDTLMATYLRIGFSNIIYGGGKKVDPKAKTPKFANALARDVDTIFQGLELLFSRKDAMYLVKSLSCLEFLTSIVTCEDVFAEVPEIWEHDVLETYYDCSIEYMRGALLCRKDMDAKTIAPLLDQLVEIKDRYHQTVPPPELEVVTLINFSYD